MHVSTDLLLDLVLLTIPAVNISTVHCVFFEVNASRRQLVKTVIYNIWGACACKRSEVLCMLQFSFSYSC